MPEFVGGRNVTLTKITLEYSDAPGLGTLWQVYQDRPGDRILVRIVTDTEHPDGVAEFRNGAEAAGYIEEFYEEAGYGPEDLADGYTEFLARLREL